eukprot:TRINITY_DN7029_c0_g1_i1.p1 TRINITY_DN7029_c0_g1~~TRINITY_DN7029_c0_g1_i1.p1  ORF type:complete len:322 (-),score=49.99 TRINITY_DN7029_c0_g1_i1:180-1145(-)
MNFKMMISLVLVFTFVAFTQSSELDDEIDKQLSHPTEVLKAESRYSYVTSTFYDWVKNVNFVNYGAYYLTFPEKTSSSVFVNGTLSNVFPLSYTLAGAALIAYVSAYLLSFIPVGESSDHRNRNDDFDPDLGFGLNRDTEIFFDEFGNEIDDYDYQYPDSIDFGSFSSFSSASEPKISTRKTNGDLVDRKGDGRSINTKKTAKSIGRTGVYEDYWKKRRSGILKKSSNVEENTFRNKNRISAVNHYLKPNAPLPYGKEEPYHYPTSQDTPGSYHSGPSWPGQDTENEGGIGESDIAEVYGKHFGVDGGNGDTPVEYVYSQK